MHLILKRYFLLLLKYLKPQWFRTGLMILFLLANVGMQVLNPQILRYFVDRAFGGGDTSELLVISGAFILAILVSQCVAVLYSYLSESVAWTATNQLRADLVAHCLTLDMKFYSMYTSGELLERIDGDVLLLANFFSQLFVVIISNILVALVVLVLFFQINVLAGLIMTVFALCWVLVLVSIRRRALPYALQLRQKTGKFFGFFSEYLLGLEDLRANGATAFLVNKFYQQRQGLLRAKIKSGLRSFLLMNASYSLLIIGVALAFALGIYLWSHHAVSLGTIYLMYAYIEILTIPVNQIQLQLQNIQQAEACIQRVEELFAMQSAISDCGEHTLPARALSIEFDDVSFGYSADDPVIHHISFSLQAGKSLGIVGRTGSGKTTLARLLFRFYDPQSGEIRLDNIPLAQIKLQELRTHIGMVTQDVQIFHASVRDNLTFFDDSVADEHLLQALEEVGLTSWYKHLAQGLDTELGSSGEGISAGEAQLLAFARIFLRNPGVVLLDEASSRLDPATEVLIEQAMRRLFTQRTVIVIAHRPETIKHIDELIVIDQGRVLTHELNDPLANGTLSYFAHLLQAQTEEVQG